MARKNQNKPSEDEEVVEMGEGRNGKFYPMAIVKPNPPPMSSRRSPAMEFLGGFVIGLEALENFMVNVRKFGRGRNVNLD
jgi:hypothetical protein